ILPTYHEKIRIFKGKDIEPNNLNDWLSQLRTLLDQRDDAKVLQHLAALVPEYKSQKAEQPADAAAERPASAVSAPAVGIPTVAIRSPYSLSPPSSFPPPLSSTL